MTLPPLRTGPRIGARTGPRIGPRIGALVVACFAAPLSAPAQEAVGDPQQGAGLYDLYCATCHGAEGRGDGPTAEIMTLQPADLTALSAANAGVFPTARGWDTPSP